uniref:GTPase IMAP family member GIMD1 n=1 Tax=Leptobrachium leishanense TaxID=445787 RepID=A0A8C5LNB7_9ANUR
MADTNEITMNILLLGKTKSGKSSLGNSLLGSYEFESQFFPYSLTTECRLCRIRIPQFARRMGKELCLKLQVLDTPGSPHSSLTQEEVKYKIKRALSQQFAEGLHMALLVLRADIPLYYKSPTQLFLSIQDLLGPNWIYFTTVIFTHGDQLHEAQIKEDEYIRSAPKTVSSLLEKVHNRYIFRDPLDRTLRGERAILASRLLDYVRQNSYQTLQTV